MFGNWADVWGDVWGDVWEAEGEAPPAPAPAPAAAGGGGGFTDVYVQPEQHVADEELFYMTAMVAASGALKCH